MNEVLFKVICGSKLYGTDIPSSDTDYMEILSESKEQLLGIEKEHPLPQKVTEEVDVNQHWLRNALYLCTRCNPNVLEALFAPKDKILICHDLFTNILARKSIFLSLKLLKGSHFGFANAQIKKMEIYSADRGAARKELIDKYGYDLKYAAHALRLIWQLESFVTENTIVYPYNEVIIVTLRSIKLGQVSKANFLEMYQREVKRIEKIVDENRGRMQLEPDYSTVNIMLVNFYESYFKWKPVIDWDEVPTRMIRI